MGSMKNGGLHTSPLPGVRLTVHRLAIAQEGDAVLTDLGWRSVAAPTKDRGEDDADGEQGDAGGGGGQGFGGVEGACGRGNAEEDQPGGDDFAVWLYGQRERRCP